MSSAPDPIGTSAAEDYASASPLVEVRTIDYVPHAERFGRGSQLFTVTFAGQAMLATVATGVIGVAAGLPFSWTLVALFIGTVVGTCFVAFHSAQGPQLGLPQMIQSRPQFGFLGANLIWIVALINYVGYNVFNIILAGQALSTLSGLGRVPSYLLFFVLAATLAVFGYRWIHEAQRWISYLLLLTLAILTVGVFTTSHVPGIALAGGNFKFAPFMLQISAAISYQISWAIYMSDYSRYLPESVGLSKPFWWTFAGVWLGGIWLMMVGAVSTALFPKLGITEGILRAGDHVLPGFGTFVVWAFLPGLLTISTMNMYGGSLTMLSMADCISHVRSSISKRVATVVGGGALAVVIAFLANGSFINEFSTFLSVLLYLIAPWSAINLVDYYFVRHGRYSIREIFNRKGIYGGWSWRGLTAYVVGFVAMIPFWSTSFYTGPVAHALGGGDISVVVGFPVAGVLYWVLAQSLNLSSERERVVAADEGLESTGVGVASGGRPV